MSHDFVQKRVRVTDPLTDGSGHVNLNTTGVKMVFAPATPVKITHWGFISDSAFTTAAAMQLAVNKRTTVGGADTQISTITVGNAVAVANGGGYGQELHVANAATTGSDNSTDNVAPTNLELVPGQAVSVSVVTAAGAVATGLIFIEYVERGFIDKSGPDVFGNAGTTYYTLKTS